MKFRVSIKDKGTMIVETDHILSRRNRDNSFFGLVIYLKDGRKLFCRDISQEKADELCWASFTEGETTDLGKYEFEFFENFPKEETRPYNIVAASGSPFDCIDAVSEKEALEIFLSGRDFRQYFSAVEKDHEGYRDTVLLHTNGLEEGIRCALCKNPMKSETGCDGGCRYDESLLKRIMDTIYVFTEGGN